MVFQMEYYGIVWVEGAHGGPDFLAEDGSRSQVDDAVSRLRKFEEIRGVAWRRSWGGYSPTISISGESGMETGEYEGLTYPGCGISGLGGNVGWVE